MAKIFSILVGILVLTGVVEAKTTSKTLAESSGISVGGSMPLSNCYLAVTGVTAQETETKDLQTKAATWNSYSYVTMTIYYTCGWALEIVFEASGNDETLTGELVVSEDKRTAWFRKTMSVFDKDGFSYIVDIDIAVVADSEPWFSDNRNKSWNKSKSFQQTTHTKAEYHSGRAFGTISVSGANYFDNGAGYVYGVDTSSTTVNK